MRDTIGEVIDDPSLRGKVHVFQDRGDAAKALAEALRDRVLGIAVVLAIPSGGFPVAAAIARERDWPVDLVIVRKLQIPYQPEAGFGAVILRGDMILNQKLVSELGLTAEDIEEAKRTALEAGRARERALGRERGTPIDGRTAVVVDDGLASGYTMLAALHQIRQEGAERVVVAVPTGSDSAVRMVSEAADQLICLNIRGGAFAVADAYRRWYDLTEEEAAEVWGSLRQGNGIP
jgi:predicted phosphoribosyltransferase